jgi:uncharacterized membrane protein HdeD (DUF308 family)
MTILLLSIVGTAAGIIGMRWPVKQKAPAFFNLAGFVLASNVAGVLAWVQVLRNQRAAVWEPTRR